MKHAFITSITRLGLMLQQSKPGDDIVATNETHSVRDFLDRALALVDLDSIKHVQFDSRYLHPTRVDLLIGDPSLSREKLGWTVRTSIDELERIVITADLKQEHQISRLVR